MMQDPAMGQPMEAPQEPQSFEVCISQNPDGTFSVSKEVKEEATEPMGEEAGQVAQTIDEALDMARQMLQDSGEGTPEDQVMAGYNKGQTTAKPTPQTVFGE